MANKITGNITQNGLGLVKATVDGIQFDTIRQNNKMAQQAIGVAITSNQDVWKASGSTTNWLPSINAVDIDWNGAHVGDKTINTTGELLAYIKELKDTISVLSSNVGTLLGWTN